MHGMVCVDGAQIKDQYYRWRCGCEPLCSALPAKVAALVSAGPTYRRSRWGGNRKKTTKNQKTSTFTLFVPSSAWLWWDGKKRPPNPPAPQAVGRSSPILQKGMKQHHGRKYATTDNFTRRAEHHARQKHRKRVWARPSGPTLRTEPAGSVEAGCRSHAQKRKIHCS